jgi:hypothetical protein
MTIAEELPEYLKKLDDAQQQQLLNFARNLSEKTPLKGEPMEHFLRAPRLFDAQALDEMEAAIEEEYGY